MRTNAREASTAEQGRINTVQRLNEVLSESRRLRTQLERFFPHDQSESSMDLPEALRDLEGVKRTAAAEAELQGARVSL